MEVKYNNLTLFKKCVDRLLSSLAEFNKALKGMAPIISFICMSMSSPVFSFAFPYFPKFLYPLFKMKRNYKII